MHSQWQQALVFPHSLLSPLCLVGDWVLVHAAAGGTGQMLVQICSHIGAKVIGTTSSAEKADLAKWVMQANADVQAWKGRRLRVSYACLPRLSQPYGMHGLSPLVSTAACVLLISGRLPVSR